MTRCAVLHCKNYAGKKSMDNTIRFHVFPKDPKIFREWSKVCGGGISNSYKHRICSAHFEESDYKLRDILLNVPKNKRSLKEDAIPTINVITTSSAMFRRKKIRIRRELVEEALRSYEQSQGNECAADQENVLLSSDSKIIKNGAPPKKESSQQTEILERENKEVQTEIDVDCPRELRVLKVEAKVRRLKAKLEKLREIRPVYNESQLRKLFTPGQIRHMEEPNKNFRWCNEDLAAAISLYNAGGRVYRILRKRGFPLPSPSTVRKSRAKLDLLAAKRSAEGAESATPTLGDHTYC